MTDNTNTTDNIDNEDTLYNRVAEHNAGEHVTLWDGCPWCEGDVALAEKIQERYGL